MDTKKVLQDSYLRATETRIQVLEELSHIHAPVSAQDVHEKTGIDLVTVYRTFSSFEEKGIVRRIDLRSGSALYELSEGHHHHIVCTDCGKVEDFQECDVEKLLPKVGKKWSIRDHSLELFGVCGMCK